MADAHARFRNGPVVGAARIVYVKTITRSAVWWVSLFMLYLLLVGKVMASELTAGAIVSALLTGAINAVSSKRDHDFSVRRSWIRSVRFVPARMLTDCVTVLVAIWRRPMLQRGTGRFQVRPFAHGEERPLVRTRRAWITLALSITPNTFMVQAHPNRDQILVHELSPRGSAPENKYWPI